MTVPVGYVLRPTARDEAINACIDAYLLAQRKAKAFDLAVANYRNAGRIRDAEYLESLVSQILEN